MNANSYENHGGALYIQNSYVILTVSEFQHNIAEVGGALTVESSSLNLTRNTFHSNSAQYGGAVYINTSNSIITGNTFKYNSAAIDGGTLHVLDSTLSLTVNTFQSNAAEFGGAFWVGYDNGNESRGLILHPNCPFDYCTSKKTYFAVDDSDKQCNYNRSGLVCGRCSQNLSLALGSSRCLQCSNSYLSLLAAFGLAGVALVLLLLVLRLTVAAETINGLIFYANIIAVNSAIFFKPQVTIPTGPIANVLSVFIAWLNLDLGIEICFYNGMDA